MVGVYQVFELHSDESVAGVTQQCRETGIAIHDLAIGAQHRSSLLHALHESSIGQISVLKCVYGVPVSLFDDKRVNATTPNGFEDLFALIGGHIAVLNHAVFHTTTPISR